MCSDERAGARPGAYGDDWTKLVVGFRSGGGQSFNWLRNLTVTMRISLTHSWRKASRRLGGFPAARENKRFFLSRPDAPIK